MVSVSVDLSQCVDLSNMTKEMQKEGMKKTSLDLINNLMRNSPWVHGHLAGWFVESETDDEIVIKSPAKYAGWVNDGHSQRPGRFIPGKWVGDRFEYIPGNKTGMVLKKPYVPGKKFVEKSIEATSQRIPEFFTIKGG